eukprot:8254227-Pyramimonas_sp.AAC.1
MQSEEMGSGDRAASLMSRRRIGDAGDVSATSAWRSSGSTSNQIPDASAMRRDPPAPSTSTPLARPGVPPPS